MPHILSAFAKGLEMNLNSENSILYPENKKALEASPTKMSKDGLKGKKKADPEQERIRARLNKLL